MTVTPALEIVLSSSCDWTLALYREANSNPFSSCDSSSSSIGPSAHVCHMYVNVCHMDVTCTLHMDHTCHMCVTCMSNVYHMFVSHITRMSHVCHTHVTNMSHVCNITVPVKSHCTVWYFRHISGQTTERQK